MISKLEIKFHKYYSSYLWFKYLIHPHIKDKDLKKYLEDCTVSPILKLASFFFFFFFFLTLKFSLVNYLMHIILSIADHKFPL